MSDNFNNPFEMYQPGAADQFLAGFLNQVAQAVDDAVTHEVLFKLNFDSLDRF